MLFAFPRLSRAADSTAEINRWFSVQTNLLSWQAEFTETRTLKTLNQPLVSPGHVWVKPGEFRWELGQPVSTIVLRHPDQLLLIYPQLKHVEKYSLDGNPPAEIKEALSLLDASLPRDRVTMEKQFHLISAFETNSVLQMNLQPNSASARKLIGDVTIGFHTNDFSIAFTAMKVADGSVLRNDFTNVIMNQSIDDSKFDAKLPPDYTITEPLRH